MISAGRSKIDFKVQTTLGNAAYSNIIGVVGEANLNSSDPILCADLDEIQTLPYFYLSSASTVKVSSTSNNDNETGIGARTVLVIGLDEDYKILQELVILNGQTPVLTLNEFLRVFEMIIVTYGSNIDSDTGDSISDGDIFCGTGTVISGIPENKLCGMRKNRVHSNSRIGIYTVPDNNLGIIKSIIASSDPSFFTSNFMSFRIAIRPFGVGENQYFKSPWYNFDGQFQYIPEALILVPPKTDIEFRIKNGGIGTKDVAVTLEIQFEELR